MKNSSDTIENQTRDPPTCSAVPQPTALPRAPKRRASVKINKFKKRCILLAVIWNYLNRFHFIMKFTIIFLRYIFLQQEDIYSTKENCQNYDWCKKH